NIALFQPLTLVSIVGYYNENRSLQRLNEITCQHPYLSINRNIKKTAIAIYLAEFLNNILKHEEPNQGLFGYVKDSLIRFDSLETGYENFHLNFIINCAKYLGFAPENAEYLFSSVPGNVTSTKAGVLDKLMEPSYPNDILLDNNTRIELLEMIITYYRLHIEGFKQMNSSGILHDVLN
ncbi:MAG: DNA repair protein RecO C-terminal domain-containing protein, partial [Cyclobacteriaceae bacterium]